MGCCNHGYPGMYAPFAPAWSSFIDFSPTVPQLYWNVDSNEQRYHLLCRQLHKLICYADMLGEKINITHDDVARLEAEFEKFKESGFLDYYEQQLEAWINANMPEIIGKYIRMVFFGLTLDGYFVAYIPEGNGWDDIVFDTGAVYGTNEYGRLILLMDVDGARPVMPDYSLSGDFGMLQQLIEDIEQRVERNENALYNPLHESEVTNNA